MATAVSPKIDLTHLDVEITLADILDFEEKLRNIADEIEERFPDFARMEVPAFLRELRKVRVSLSEILKVPA